MTNKDQAAKELVEELPDEQLDGLQGGGLKARLTKAESSVLREQGSKIRGPAGQPGSKIRGPSGSPN